MIAIHLLGLEVHRRLEMAIWIKRHGSHDMDEKLYPLENWGSNHLTMSWSQINYVAKRGPRGKYWRVINSRFFGANNIMSDNKEMNKTHGIISTGLWYIFLMSHWPLLQCTQLCICLVNEIQWMLCCFAEHWMTISQQWSPNRDRAVSVNVSLEWWFVLWHSELKFRVL